MDNLDAVSAAARSLSAAATGAMDNLDAVFAAARSLSAAAAATSAMAGAESSSAAVSHPPVDYRESAQTAIDNSGTAAMPPQRSFYPQHHTNGIHAQSAAVSIPGAPQISRPANPLSAPAGYYSAALATAPASNASAVTAAPRHASGGGSHVAASINSVTAIDSREGHKRARYDLPTLGPQLNSSYRQQRKDDASSSGRTGNSGLAASLPSASHSHRHDAIFLNSVPARSSSSGDIGSSSLGSSRVAPGNGSSSGNGGVIISRTDSSLIGSSSSSGGSSLAAISSSSMRRADYRPALPHSSSSAGAHHAHTTARSSSSSSSSSSSTAARPSTAGPGASSQSSHSSGGAAPRETPRLCSVCGYCRDDDGHRPVECGRCRIAVHADCYDGAPPSSGSTKGWLCDPCAAPPVAAAAAGSGSRAAAAPRACVLCGLAGGAMKRVRKDATRASPTPPRRVSSASTAASPAASSAGVDTESATPASPGTLLSASASAAPVAAPAPAAASAAAASAAPVSPSARTITFARRAPAEWAHVVCALWVPEAYMNDATSPATRSTISGVDRALSLRGKLKCCMCHAPPGRGAPVQCLFESCMVAYHVTCGMLSDAAASASSRSTQSAVDGPPASSSSSSSSSASSSSALFSASAPLPPWGYRPARFVFGADGGTNVSLCPKHVEKMKVPSPPPDWTGCAIALQKHFPSPRSPAPAPRGSGGGGGDGRDQGRFQSHSVRGPDMPSHSQACTGTSATAASAAADPLAALFGGRDRLTTHDAAPLRSPALSNSSEGGSEGPPNSSLVGIRDSFDLGTSSSSATMRRVGGTAAPRRRVSSGSGAAAVAAAPTSISPQRQPPPRRKVHRKRFREVDEEGEGGSGQFDEEGEFGGLFNCSVCLKTCVDPVTAHCGARNFCRACLSKWLLTKASTPVCPECREDISSMLPRLLQVNVGIAHAIDLLTRVRPSVLLPASSASASAAASSDVLGEGGLPASSASSLGDHGAAALGSGDAAVSHSHPQHMSGATTSARVAASAAAAAQPHGRWGVSSAAAATAAFTGASKFPPNIVLLRGSIEKLASASDGIE